MRVAIKNVSEGKGLKEAARLYNAPVETLRRVTDKVDNDCHPGPPTVLMKEEETTLCY